MLFYFAARNIYAKQKPDTIDVHGLRPGEAIEKTESALRMALERGQGSLRVIVGKGLHSVNGRAILKAVVQREMERFVSHWLVRFLHAHFYIE